MGAEHIHILILCPPTILPAEIAKRLKGRSSSILQGEYKELSKKYCGQNM